MSGYRSLAYHNLGIDISFHKNDKVHNHQSLLTTQIPGINRVKTGDKTFFIENKLYDIKRGSIYNLYKIEKFNIRLIYSYESDNSHHNFYIKNLSSNDFVFLSNPQEITIYHSDTDQFDKRKIGSRPVRSLLSYSKRFILYAAEDWNIWIWDLEKEKDINIQFSNRLVYIDEFLYEDYLIGIGYTQVSIFDLVKDQIHIFETDQHINASDFFVYRSTDKRKIYFRRRMTNVLDLNSMTMTSWEISDKIPPNLILFNRDCDLFSSKENPVFYYQTNYFEILNNYFAIKFLVLKEILPLDIIRLLMGLVMKLYNYENQHDLINLIRYPVATRDQFLRRIGEIAE